MEYVHRVLELHLKLNVTPSFLFLFKSHCLLSFFLIKSRKYIVDRKPYFNKQFTKANFNIYCGKFNTVNNIMLLTDALRQSLICIYYYFEKNCTYEDCLVIL